MRKAFFIVSILLSINSFGQIKTEKVNGLKITNQVTVFDNDTIIKVIYKNEIKNDKKPAYFINGKLANESILRSINPNEIETVNVEKENIEIENVKYYGKLYIVTKSTYKPKLISLNNSFFPICEVRLLFMVLVVVRLLMLSLHHIII